ncbi:hypothetical protein GCM10010082_30290 [Kushneria pakistanensis]|uniref:Flagellar protein FlhE n=1 Tax=Kushneria pakistanensis TaxID=1508770 RepID=A0ABQ3FR09_9GAMM|nr:flagellar protein FlhE [Kushneria pakistanensis]GHC33526.1 hypothetical protein GCM10010082_30290 [Kushneria pakistanensis]
MTRHQLPRWLMITIVLVLSPAQADASAGGAIPAQGSVPDMAQKGREYRVALIPADTAPADGVLTELSWHYELTPGAVMPAAWLCTPSVCESLSMARGSTDALAGLPANTPLSLHFVLPGEGMLKRPVQGGAAQVFINYRMQAQ